MLFSIAVLYPGSWNLIFSIPDPGPTKKKGDKKLALFYLLVSAEVGIYS
jgi:hypothetical protein